MLGLIIIFVLLGLAFLVGGAGAIVDGWPYLVLERGFTQVIIGSVAATAGVILLALAWVLTELRRVRTALRAMSPLSAADLPDEAAARTVDREREPVLTERAAPEPEGKPAGLGTAAAGAGLAAAGGALATAFADRGIGEHGETDRKADEATRPAEEPAPVAHDEVAQDEGEPAQPEPPAQDIFDEALLDVAAARKSGDEPPPPSEHEVAEPETAPDEAEAEPVAAELHDVAPDDEDRIVPEAQREPAQEPEPVEEPEAVSEPEPREEPRRSTWWPRFGSRASEPAAEPRTAEADDLTALRYHLTRGPQPPTTPGEPEETAAGERRGEPDLGAAEDWTEPAAGRREPSFDEPVPAEPTAPEPEEQAEPERSAAGEPIEEPSAEVSGEQPPAEEAETSEPPRPAASEEGVIGAYQVGDTHFTMYADGSIKARTPEGEYSFASMDELKAYLASEKSKLGG